jgi:hypothetical protein
MLQVILVSVILLDILLIYFFNLVELCCCSITGKKWKPSYEKVKKYFMFCHVIHCPVTRMHVFFLVTELCWTYMHNRKYLHAIFCSL